MKPSWLALAVCYLVGTLLLSAAVRLDEDEEQLQALADAAVEQNRSRKNRTTAAKASTLEEKKQFELASTRAEDGEEVSSEQRASISAAGLQTLRVILSAVIPVVLLTSAALSVIYKVFSDGGDCVQAGTPEAGHNYRPDVDGLRSVAIIAVVIFHMHESWIPGGFVGVDIFFVISGYVMASSCVKRSEKEEPLEFLVGIYSRRVKRLLPCLLLVVTCTSTLMEVIIPPETYDTKEHHIIGIFGLVGFANNYMALQVKGYFDEGLAPRNPYLHTWSLGVEEQFYFVFPFVVIAAHRLRPFRWWPVVVWASTMLASAIVCHELLLEPKLVFYLLPTRFWELAAGALVFEVLSLKGPAEATPSSTAIGFGLQAVAVLAIAWSMLATKADSNFPWPSAGLPVLGTMAFIASWNYPYPVVNALTGNAVFIYIGKISYVLYLWHWPVIILLRNWTATGQSDLNLVIIMIVLAVLTHHFVEMPILSWRPAKTLDILTTILPASLMVAVLLLGFSGFASGKLYVGRADNLLAKAGAIPEKATIFDTFNSGCKCQLNLPTTYKPHLSATYSNASKLPACTAANVPWSGSHMKTGTCWVEEMCDPKMIDYIPQCLDRQAKPDRRGEGEAVPTMFLFGDSVSVSAQGGIEKAAHGAGFQFRSWQGIECTLARTRRTCNLCDKVWAKQKETLRSQLRAGDIVSVMLHHTKFETWYGVSAETKLKNLRTDLLDLRNVTASKNATLLLFGDVQSLTTPGSQCKPTAANPFADRQCDRPRQDVEEEMRGQEKVYKELAQKYKDVVTYCVSCSTCSSNRPRTLCTRLPRLALPFQPSIGARPIAHEACQSGTQQGMRVPGLDVRCWWVDVMTFTNCSAATRLAGL
eukprot:TRINITY_DN11122_c0_g1_i4.p1 TRINITY_DN11122_c0_g1~~TRINITY_DN11122_c0_g1_i4.p1  ORF type:complete len:870 (+),score=138.33 TRINITY_DN11122_c0_g1_i4:128-2737(+)